MTDRPWFERRIVPVLRERMRESPVVALQGARSVGKSTVLRLIAEQHGVEVIDLDSEIQRRRADASPTDLVDGDPPVCIDEYQRVPGVLQAIKAQLNRQHVNGGFVLAGSSSFWALPRGTQSLTGRLHLMEIMPLSQGEIDGVREDFLTVALEDPDRLGAAGPRGARQRHVMSTYNASAEAGSLVDSGLAAHLLGISAEKLERRDAAMLAEFGHLLENFRRRRTPQAGVLA